MSELFYDIAQKLDELKKSEVPSKTELDRLTELITGPEYTRYFFYDFDSPEWVKHLHKHGWFRNPPEPLEDEDQPGYFSMPLWHEGEYLFRMAEAFPEIVKEVAIVLRTDNSRAIRTMLKALLEIPPELVTETVPVFNEWMSTPFVSFMSLVKEVGEILEYLTKAEQIDAALQLLSVLAKPIGVIQPPADEKVVARTRYDHYFLQQTFENHLPPLIEKVPVGVVNVVETQLKEAVDLEIDPNIAEEEVRLRSYWRLNINPDFGSDHHKDIKNLLTDTLIKAIDETCKQRKNESTEIIEKYIQDQYSILRRVGYFALRKWGGAYPELLEKAYMHFQQDKVALVRQSEFDRLRDDQFINLPEHIRQELLGEIRSGPSSEWVQSRLDLHYDVLEGRTKKEKKEILVERWKLREYDRLAEFLGGADKETYEKLVIKFGKPDPPQEGVVVTSWTGPESPYELTELSNKSIGEVVSLLLGFSPNEVDTFERPSKEGLGRILEEDVLQRYEEYENNVSEFVRDDLPYVYHTHLLRGLSKIVNQCVPSNPEGIIDLCEFIVSKKEDVHRSQEYEPGLDSAKQAVAEYLEKWMSVRDIVLEDRDAERIGNLLTVITYEGASEEERETDLDPATRSINSASGVALHGLIKYGLYLNRIHISKGAGDTAPILATAVKDVLTAQLDLQNKPSVALHSITGWYFPQLFYLDKEWTSNNINNIFPLEDELNEYRHAAWDAYIRFSNFYNDVFLKLIPQYRQAVLELTEPGKNAEQDRDTGNLGTHILKAYVIGLIDLDSQDNLVKSYYLKADVEARSQGCYWVSKFLEANKLSAEDNGWKRILSLWVWRLREATEYESARKINKEIASFSRLLKHTPLELGGMYPILEQMLNYKAEGYELNLIIEYLGKNRTSYPAQAITLLHSIMTGRRDLYLTNDIKDIVWEILVDSMDQDDATKNKIVEIINDFGKRGDYRWRELLPIMN